jgi:hypothetical protein
MKIFTGPKTPRIIGESRLRNFYREFSVFVRPFLPGLLRPMHGEQQATGSNNDINMFFTNWKIVSDELHGRIFLTQACSLVQNFVAFTANFFSL